MSHAEVVLAEELSAEVLTQGARVVALERVDQAHEVKRDLLGND